MAPDKLEKSIKGSKLRIVT